MTETVSQLKDGENQLALGRPSLLESSLQSELLDIRSVRGCRREIVDGGLRIRLATPSVPSNMCQSTHDGTLYWTIGFIREHCHGHTVCSGEDMHPTICEPYAS